MGVAQGSSRSHSFIQVSTDGVGACDSSSIIEGFRHEFE